MQPNDRSVPSFESRRRRGVEGKGKDAGIDDADRHEGADPAQDDLEDEEGVQILGPAQEAHADGPAHLALRRRDGDAQRRRHQGAQKIAKKIFFLTWVERRLGGLTRLD